MRKNKMATFPEGFPQIGQTIRFLAKHEVREDIIVTVEALVVARMHWDAGNSGYNLVTSSAEFREIEYHGPSEKDFDWWGESSGIDPFDGSKVNYTICELEVL